MFHYSELAGTAINTAHVVKMKIRYESCLDLNRALGHVVAVLTTGERLEIDRLSAELENGRIPLTLEVQCRLRIVALADMFNEGSVSHQPIPARLNQSLREYSEAHPGNGLCARTITRLELAGYTTVADVLSEPQAKLERRKCIGKKTLTEIREFKKQFSENA